MNIRIASSLLVTLLFALPGCGSSEPNAGGSESGAAAAGEGGSAGEASATPKSAMKDIVDTAVANGSFTTLADLLGKAGLVDALKGAGPFTVFAPTDAAFEKVDAATLAGLAANLDKLGDVLKYHVHSGKVMAGDVSDGMDVSTLQGSSAKISVADGNVMIDGATVTSTDIECSNGVIHVIDSVILPK